MKVTRFVLLGASVTVAAASHQFKPKAKPVDRRDAIPIPDVFINAAQLMPALRRRDLEEPIYYASVPEGIVKRSLETRQWGCETVGQINCFFQGCCNVGTFCGTFGGQTGCCPIGKLCTGVGSCKTPETACGSGCCPSNAICTSNADGSAACDYGIGLSGSSSTRVSPVPTATSARSSSVPTSICPVGYSPCAGTDVCCPAGVKCLPNNKCDAKCSAIDVRCGTGCCTIGLTCDASTSICVGTGSGESIDSVDIGIGSSSSRRVFSSRSTTSFTRATSTPDSGISVTTARSNAESSVGAGGNTGGGNSGVIVGSSGSRLVAGMGIAGVVAVVGVAFL
ncbi:unnamed protein product [Tuber aestivum]|uniref:Granulins domain-containing protein n=1 Tax=Tuber aestivum TaxID=59557 RepID=A0A292PIV9_9PEZI|nr:unnamed protein product [Tuber aestivum]